MDDDSDGLDDRLEQQLAENFAPIIVFSTLEPNYPVNVDWLLQRSELCFRGPRRRYRHPSSAVLNQQILGGDTVPLTVAGVTLPPPAFTRPETLGSRSGWYLRTVDPPWRRGSLDPSMWVTYTHVYPAADGGVMIQYWHLFAYNYQLLTRHGGDWDACIHVHLDNNHRMRGAWFSRHLDDHPGTFVPATAIETVGSHPIVAIDEGGHASYSSPDDWLAHPGSPIRVPGAAIAWPRDPADPQTLIPFASNGRRQRLRRTNGGTIWQTWTGGQVSQAGNVKHRLEINPSRHGGLINVGEYNPGGRQISSFLAGHFGPLNGQSFIAYSGFWGTPHPIWHSPRGPVFQGYHNNRYRAWYNNAPDQTESRAA